MDRNFLRVFWAIQASVALFDRKSVESQSRLLETLGLSQSCFLPRTFSSHIQGLLGVISVAYNAKIADFEVLGSYGSSHGVCQEMHVNGRLER